jgi:hypothetical protein
MRTGHTHGKRKSKKRIKKIRRKGGDHWEDLGVDGRTTLRCILGKYGLGMWIGLIGLRIGTGGGLL